MNNLFGKYTKVIQTELVGVAGWLGLLGVTGAPTRANWYALGIIVLMGAGTYSGDNTPRS